MATSTTLRRAWARDGRRAHHLIDPRTGRPVQGELVGVTVVAPTATMAEVLAKSAIVSGSIEAGRSLLDAYGLAGLLVPVDGPVVPVGDFEAMCWTAPGGLV
jgi:thiamine biosynthesis lipoprotein